VSKLGVADSGLNLGYIPAAPQAVADATSQIGQLWAAATAYPTDRGHAVQR
jgi:hypothetical protein